MERDIHLLEMDQDRMDWEADQEEIEQLGRKCALLEQVAGRADDLFDALFAQQDLWSDKRYREIQVAAVKVDIALTDLTKETDYVRQENRADGG